MAGFNQDPLQIINLISDNLRDRYQSDSVLKEIIQNSDDAGVDKQSIFLEFGLVDGISNTSHPLLSGQALFFLNNGRFLPQDAKAIRSFGLNYKAAESSSIGKFGLGMKSVFHFCEAFFFLAHDDGQQYAEILNPWSANSKENSLHADWDNFKQADQKCLLNQLKPVFDSLPTVSKSWFLLWLPLRKQYHLQNNGQKTGNIIDNFPGDDSQLLAFLHENGLATELAGLLPLLRKVDHLRHWQLVDGQVQTLFKVEGNQDNVRLAPTGKLLDGSRQIQGRFDCQPGNGTESCISIAYAGREQLLCGDNQLKALRESSLWPKTQIRNTQGYPKQVPDKATGHAAVVFTWHPDQLPGKLIIRWAVFLPLGNHKEEISCDLNGTVTVTLHGFFFIDAGRGSIAGLNEDIPHRQEVRNESELRQKWNKQLATEGVMPLFLPALADFVKKAQLNSLKIASICKSLCDSNFYRNFRQHLCRHHQLLRCLTSRGGKWMIIPAAKKILPLPAPPQTIPNRLWDVLPQLSQDQNDLVLIDKDAPYLRNSSLPQWNETDLLNILEINAALVFTHKGRLSYYIKTLQYILNESVRIRSTIAVQGKLIEILQAAFSSVANDLRQQQQKVREFSSLILPVHRYPLPIKKIEVLRKLQQCAVKPLLLSVDFDCLEKPGTARLTPADTLLILRDLSELMVQTSRNNADEVYEDCRKSIIKILDDLQEVERQTLLSGAGKQLRILEGYDCLYARRTNFSFAELQTCYDNNFLFRFSQGTTEEQRLGLATVYQQIINGRIIVINTDTAKIISGDECPISSCDADGCLQSLGTIPSMKGTTEDRKQLLSRLAGVELSGSLKKIRGIRYLIHGHREHATNISTIIWVRGSGVAQAWEKLWRYINSGAESQWTLLDKKIVFELPPKSWEHLGIKEIKPEHILGELDEDIMLTLKGDQFPHDERWTILKGIRHKSSLWKSLPFHETVSGKLVAIGEHTLLATDIALPLELHSHVTLIKQSDDQDIFQQQQEWIEPFDDTQAIITALRHPEPHLFADLIMDHLGKTPTALDNKNLCGQLRESSWLYNASQKPVKPKDVIYLPEIQDDVGRLLSVSQDTYCSPSSLSEKIQNHLGYELLKSQLFTGKQQGMKILALLASKTARYHLGIKQTNTDNIEVLAGICAELPEDVALPGWRLLHQGITAFGRPFCEQLLLGMCKPIDSNRLVGSLYWLQNEHETANGKRKQAAIKAFNTYLEALTESPQARECLPRLKLLNQESKWCPARELCAEIDGIAGSHLLSTTHKDILKNILMSSNNIEQTKQSSSSPDTCRNNPSSLNQRQLASIDKLTAFFSKWESLIAQELICSFIILLGDQPKMRNLAKRYRGNHTIDWICENIPWEQIPAHDGLVISDASKNEAFSLYRFLIEVIEGKSIKVNSIIGEMIQVPLISTIDGIQSLIVGTPEKDILNKDGEFYVLLQIRQPNLNTLSPDTLSTILKQSAEIVLRKVYQRHHCNLDRLWSELSKSDQLGIHIAQQLVLENALFYLRQLGIHKNPILKTELNKWNEVRHKISEFRDNKQKVEQYESERRNIIETIKDLLQNNPDVEHDVLEAVKIKVQDYQYNHTSIPFELFQNADDAVVELEEIKNYLATNTNPGSSNLPNEAARFQVIVQNKSITFQHWGRPINYIGSGGFQGREKGYHWDMEKMLILSSSEKNENEYVTGKFGLGFKSVFLASDKPKVVSGTLAFEIIAGFYPQSMKLATKRKLISTIRKKHDCSGLKTTHIHLPLHEEISSSQVLNSFRNLAGYLTIFAKKIRRVEILNRSTGQSREQIFDWKPKREKLESGTTIEVGSLPSTNNHLVYFRQKDSGILLAVGPNGFQPLPKDVPGVWVVAPTVEQKGLGFAVNGMFVIDTGRAQLSRNDEKNDKVAQWVGRSLGHTLVDLFTMAQQNWTYTKKLFHLANGLSAYQFWASLWQILTGGHCSSNNNPINTLLKNILTNQYGISYLIREKEALPNGLWGDFQTLTKPDKIRWVLQGPLSTEAVFQPLLEWSYFRNLLKSHATAISSTVYEALKTITPSFAQTTGQWEMLHLADVFQRLSDGKHIITPEEANILSKVINHERLKDKIFDGERSRIDIVLKTLLFRSKDNTTQLANVLLASTYHPHANDDERRRAAFAPETFILNHAYDKQSLDFFFSCREKIEVPVECMTQWVLQAEESQKRTAALHYLIEGEHANKIAKEIREKNLRGSWLHELHPNSPYFEGWDDHKRRELLFRVLPSLHDLEQFRQVADDVADDEIPGNLFSCVDPHKTLEKIYQWWQRVSHNRLHVYEQKWYPSGRKPRLTEDDFGNINRADWLILLMLGHCHTIGRQRPEQHRTFIETCQQKGWWDIFAAPNPKNRPDEWMGVLEDYIASQIETTEYEHWMNRFPVLYRFSRDMDDCTGIFLSLNQREDIENLSMVLNPKADPSQQGGGYNAAPMARTLGIGACFVLRELKRQGLIQKNHVVPYCYIPVKRVRDMCTQLGCQGLNDNASTQASTAIYRFLCDHLGPEKATFNGAYDIPLQMCLEEIKKDKDFSLRLLN